jgi:hypothetical protein
MSFSYCEGNGATETGGLKEKAPGYECQFPCQFAPAKCVTHVGKVRQAISVTA